MTIKIGEIRVSVDLEDDATGEVKTVDIRRGATWPPGLASEPPGTEPESKAAPEVVEVPEPLDIDAEPATPDERLPTFTVDDTIDHFALVWDEGETARERRVFAAPFGDGLWMVFENGSEYVPMYKRDDGATKYEEQQTAGEARLVARGYSCRWIRVDQGNRVRQMVAQVHAIDWVRWVGRTIHVDGVPYYYRQGRLVRQIKTTVLRYRATEDERHPWIEVRITQGVDAEHVDVWLLQYDADQHLIGSISERNVARRDLVKFRELAFGLAPGKRLVWIERGGELHAEFRGKTLVIIEGTDTAALMHRRRGERDVFLSCGPVDMLKRTAISSALARRRRPARSTTPGPSPKPAEPATEAEKTPELVEATPVEAASPPAVEPAPEPEPEREVALEPEPEPEPKPEPASEAKSESPQATEASGEKLRVTGRAEQALRELARAGANNGAVVQKTNKRTLNSLVRKGLLEPGTYRLTDQGYAYLGLQRPAKAKPEPEPEPEDDDDDDELTPEQQAEIAKSVESAVGSAIKSFPPVT
ncbi:MAG: hypothetical protein R3A51_23225 [Nannocystaceae bacterium]